MDQPAGVDRVGAGGLPHHHRGHHHHGQRGRHRLRLGGDDAVRLALRGLALPDTGGGPEHGLGQSQGSPGGQIWIYIAGILFVVTEGQRGYKIYIKLSVDRKSSCYLLICKFVY